MRGILGFLAVSLSLIACAGPNPDIDGVPFCETLGSGAGGMGGSGGAGGGASCTVCAGDTRTGTRLTRARLTGDDGSWMPYGAFWIDTGYNNEMCAFQTLPNGEVRCIPPNEKIVTYLDEALTVPIYLFFGQCDDDLPKYAMTYTFAPDVCAPLLDNKLLRLGSEVFPKPNSYYTQKPDGSWSGSVMPANARVFALKPAPPLSTFVLGTIGDGL